MLKDILELIGVLLMILIGMVIALAEIIGKACINHPVIIGAIVILLVLSTL